MEQYWRNLFDQFGLFTQQLGLEWEAVQAEPGGIWAVVSSWLLSLGQWLHTGNKGALIQLALVVILTRRLLRNRS